MRITCTSEDSASQVLDVLERHGITAGTWWEGHSPLDERMWIHVNAAMNPAVEVAIRCDIGSIAGANYRSQGRFRPLCSRSCCSTIAGTFV